MFRIALCEDMPTERDKTLNKIETFFQRENLRYDIKTYSSGSAILSDMEDVSAVFDLIFMDIYMGESNGFETAVEIRKRNAYVPIVFLTMSKEYAVESYDVEAAGYLLKPVEDEKLFHLLSKLTRAEIPKCLTVKQRGAVKNLDYRDIVYMESKGHRVIIHLQNGVDEIVYDKLDRLEKEMDDVRFLRCHKSYLVNMDYIKYAEDQFQLTTGAIVPIRTHGKKEVVNQYTNYFINKHLGEVTR